MAESSVPRQGTAQRRRAANGLRTLGERLHLQSVNSSEAGRDELETYVRGRYAAKHGAAVRTFMPTLISFRDRMGELRGVAGIRGAHDGRLYLEQYLDAPIERLLTESVARGSGPWGGQRLVQRDEIVEVGNLAGASCRAAVRMVAQLPAYLMARRYTWIVFTATSSVRQILAGFGAPLIELGRADPACVAAAPDSWGQYYATDPRVFAGFLPDADRLAGFAHRTPGH